jgi:hypothetical protein
MADTPTFVFDDDGKAYAYLNGKVVAAAADADELEQKLAYDYPHGDYHPYDDPTYDPNVLPAGACEHCGGQGRSEPASVLIVERYRE